MLKMQVWKYKSSKKYNNLPIFELPNYEKARHLSIHNILTLNTASLFYNILILDVCCEGTEYSGYNFREDLKKYFHFISQEVLNKDKRFHMSQDFPLFTLLE